MTAHGMIFCFRFLPVLSLFFVSTQLFRALGRGSNSSYESPTQSTVFQLCYAIDGGACWGRNLVLEHPWMGDAAIFRCFKDLHTKADTLRLLR